MRATLPAGAERALTRSRSPRTDVGTASVLSAVGAACAFASGCALVQTAVIPSWRSMPPDTFLTAFRRTGPSIGAVLFPVELAATALLGVTARRTTRHRRRGSREWTTATLLETGTVALLGVYFARANSALMSAGFPVERVGAERERWRRWNGIRTVLAVLAALLSAVAATRTLRTPTDLTSAR